MAFTNEELAIARRFLERATPGPFKVNRYDNDGGDLNWQVQSDHHGGDDNTAFPVLCNIQELETKSAKADAHLIVWLLNNAKQLLLLAEASRWIPATEDLPKQAGPVLVKRDKHTKPSTSWFSPQLGTFSHIYLTNKLYADVTHWRYMPSVEL